MSISAPIFLIGIILFLPLLFALTKKGHPSWWVGYLLINSIFLYCKSPGSLLIIFFLAATTIYLSIQMENAKAKENNERARAIYLVTMLTIGLTWMMSKHALFDKGGVSLSYISFLLIALITEIYWSRKTMPSNWLGVFTLLTSFSSISSGPVIQVRSMLNQVVRPMPLTAVTFKEASFLIFCGLAKKNVANHLVQLNDLNRNAKVLFGALDFWIYELYRSAYLYADFSGYSDIAVGVGLLIGYRLPENFHLPFLATSVSKYWRSWNSSITQWFLTYVFTPITLQLRWLASGTGNFSLHLPAFVGTLCTLLLIGIWHGFSWNQVVWASFVALLIILESALPQNGHGGSYRVRLFLGWATTFYFMLIARILSTETNLSQAFELIIAMHRLPLVPLHTSQIQSLILALAALVIPHTVDYLRHYHTQIFLSNWRWSLAIMLFTGIIVLFSGIEAGFIYEGF